MIRRNNDLYPRRNAISFALGRAVLGVWLVLICRGSLSAQEPIAVEMPPADKAIDFAVDILPSLQKKCLACHNATKAEGDVVLETPELLRAERDGGPLVVPGNVDESRLFHIAAHRDEPVMPPADNAAGATALTPVELGLLHQWIVQGAKDSNAKPPVPAVHWQPIPAGYRPILAAAVAEIDELVVCSRGNEVNVYGLFAGAQRGALVAALVDPTIDAALAGPRGAAHEDLIRAVAVRPIADQIATAGFRSVKLWQRRQPTSLEESVVPGAAVWTSSVDGKQLALASADGTIQRFDLSGTMPALKWNGLETPLAGLAFARDGAVLVSASKSGTVRAWRTLDGKALGAWKISVAPRHMIMAADDALVTTADDLALRVWTVAIPTDPPAEPVAATSSPDAVAGEKPTAPPTPIEPTALEPVHTLKGHGRTIEAIASLPAHPKQFLSGSTDGTIRQWNAETGAQVNLWTHGEAVTALSVQSDGTRFVSLSADRTAKVWNVAATDAVSAIQGDYRRTRGIEQQGRMVEVERGNVAFAQAGAKTVEQQLANDGELKTKAIAALDEAKKATAEKTTAQEETKAKQAAGATSLAATETQRTQAEQGLAEANARLGVAEQEIALLAAAVKKIEATAEFTAAAAALEKVRQDRQTYLQSLVADAQAALDARVKERDAAQAAQEALAKQVQEGETALSGANTAQQEAETALARAEESIVRSTKALEVAKQEADALAAELTLLETQYAAAAQHVQEQRPAFKVAAFSADGKRLLLGDDQGHMFVYDGETFSPQYAWDGEPTTLAAAVFAGDKECIALTNPAQGEGKLTRWSIAPEWTLGRTCGSPDDPSLIVDRVLSLEFSPDGTLLAVGSGEPSRSGQITLWNVSDGTLVRSFDRPHSDSVFGLAFSPDGQYLASAAADRTMKVFRVSNGELMRNFEGHTDHVIDVSWNANGRELATCGADNKIKIWNFTLGEQKTTIEAGSKEITQLTYIGTENKLLSSGGDRRVRLWNSENGQEIRSLTGAADYLFCCAATRKGDIVLAGGADRVLRMWNGEDGAELVKVEPPQ